MSTMPAAPRPGMPPMPPHMTNPFPGRPGGPGGPGGGSPGAASALTPQDIIRILKKRIWLITIMAALIFIASGVGTFFWIKYAPSYQAAALVRVKTPNPPQAMQQAEALPGRDVMEAYINTQAAMIVAPDNMEKALADPNVKDTQWYRQFLVGDTLDISEAMKQMKERLSATPIRDSWHIRVSFTSASGEESARIVDAVLRQYGRLITDAAQLRSTQELEQYTKRVDSLRDEIQQRQLAMERDRAAKNIPLIQQRQAQITEHVAALTSMLQEAMTGRAQAKAMYDMYNQPGADARAADTPEMRRMVDSDPTVRAYEGQRIQIELALKAAMDKGSNSRQVKDLRKQLATVEEQVNIAKQRLLSDTFRDMREQTRVQLDQANAQVIDLEERLTEVKLELAYLEGNLGKYQEQQPEIEAMKKRLAALDDYRLLIEIQKNNPELVRVDIGMATKPLERSSPKWQINLPAGLVLGLLLGVGLAFLLEFASNTVKSPSDVIRQLNLAMLGQIPSQEDDESSPEDMHKLLVEAPHSILAESFRQLRTNFQFSGPPEQMRTVLVTSCSPEEGKTCIAANLATSLALAGSRVLLIDVNFRRPDLGKLFGVEAGAQGLSNVLVGQASFASLVRPTDVANLDFLPAGPLPPNPSELLSGTYFKDMLASCREQ